MNRGNVGGGLIVGGGRGKTTQMASFLCEGGQIVPTDQPPCPVRTRPAIVYRDCLSRGTVQKADPLDVQRDIEELHKAFKSADDNVITDILSRRTNDQRQVIAKAYQEKYNTNLHEELKVDLSEQYRKAVSGLLEDPFIFLAKHVRHTLKSSALTHKDVALLEILYPLEPQEVDAIVQAYREEYDHNLEEEIEKEMSGVFKGILVRLVTGKRSTHRKVDVPQRNKDLEYLRNNTEERLQSADDNVIFRFLVLLKSVYNRTGFYADQLHMAIKDISSGSEDRLMRIVISRSEIDLENIKDFFQSAYSHTLTDFVYDDTSGDYRNLLLRLVGM
nr:annexin-B12-like [Lytechinus pictus]